MNPLTLLIANGFFLAVVLVVLLLVMVKNGHLSKKRTNVKEDIKKIKDQINKNDIVRSSPNLKN